MGNGGSLVERKRAGTGLFEPGVCRRFSAAGGWGINPKWAPTEPQFC